MKYAKLLRRNKLAMLTCCFAIFLNIVPVCAQATDPDPDTPPEDTSGICPGDGCTTTDVSDGTLDVNAEGAINGVTVNTNGVVNVNENGSASGTQINTDGTVNVNGFGTATGTVVNSGGKFNINNDGTASSTEVNAGGQMTVSGSATETTINTGGAVTVEAGGTVENTTIADGGYMDVAGSANMTEVNSGGAVVDGTTHFGLNVSGSGASANDSKVNTGGTMLVENGAIANNTVIDGGEVTVRDNAVGSARQDAATNANPDENGAMAEGATVSNTTLTSGSLTVGKGGTSDLTTVESGATMTVKEYGLAKQTTLNGSTLTVESNGTVQGTIINDSANLLIDADANATDTTINEGGHMDVKGNADNTTVGSGASMVISDSAKINGLTVKDGGSYTLSTDADVTNANLYGKQIDRLFTNKTGDGLIVGAQSSLTVKGDGKILNTEARDSAVVKIENGGTAEGTTLKGQASVEADAGSMMTNTVINDTAYVSSQGAVSNTIVNSTSSLTSAGLIVGGTAENTIVNNKGTMRVAATGTATGTIINNGGTLNTVDGAGLTDVSALKGSNLDLTAGTTVKGSILVDMGANLSGTYDYAGMINNADIKNLTLTGGVHNVFNNDLANTNAPDGRSLTLADGIYKITSETIAETARVSGWNELNIKNANVQLAGDLNMPEAENKINIGSGSTLNTAGKEFTNITGSIVNEGTLSLISQAMINTTTINGNYTAKDGASLEVRVDGDHNTADKLIVNGDVTGDTDLIIKMSSGTTPDQQIKFLETIGDDPATDSNFRIFRVESNPYLWDTTHNGADWYMGTVKQGGKSGVVSEVMAYMALPTAAIEQTRSLVYNVGSKVGNSRERKPVTRHDIYDRRYDKYYEPQINAWLSPIYSSATIDAPIGVDADIVGGEAGIDLYSGVSNKIGVFGSYRKGEYDIDANSSKYFTRYASEIDIDSYIGGLYYRHDWEDLWIVAIVFGGVQEADLTTKDRISESSDATQFGGSLAAWYNYNVNRNFDIQPTAGISYTSISYDEIKDKYGKTAEYDDFNYIEAELGVKFEYSYEMYKGFSRLYFKPSLIQTMVSGDDPKILNLTGGSEAMDDATLTRIEVGGNMDLGYDFNLFANVKYTFGSDYDDTVFAAGMNYAF